MPPSILCCLNSRDVLDTLADLALALMGCYRTCAEARLDWIA